MCSLVDHIKQLHDSLHKYNNSLEKLNSLCDSEFTPEDMPKYNICIDCWNESCKAQGKSFMETKIDECKKQIGLIKR